MIKTHAVFFCALLSICQMQGASADPIELLEITNLENRNKSLVEQAGSEIIWQAGIKTGKAQNTLQLPFTNPISLVNRSALQFEIETNCPGTIGISLKTESSDPATTLAGFHYTLAITPEETHYTIPCEELKPFGNPAGKEAVQNIRLSTHGWGGNIPDPSTTIRIKTITLE